MNREVCGLNIHYIEEGEGPLVVLLHGWGSNIELFQPTVDLLKNNYRLPSFGTFQPILKGGGLFISALLEKTYRSLVTLWNECVKLMNAKMIRDITCKQT